jgi:hypothetical protein
MERLLKNQQIPLVQVIDPISGQQYYSPESAIYTTSTDSNPIVLKNVVVDQATSSSYFSGSADRAISASYALTASYASTSDIPSLQQVVNIGNSLVNFGGLGTASLLSVNFVNNRSLYLNNDAYPTIRLVDNNNASNNLQIDIDTISLDGTSYNWSDIVNNKDPFPYTGSAIITGSLNVTGSISISGSGTLNGCSIITSCQTGSFYTTSSFGFYGAFCSTSSQTNPVGNVSRSMQLETTELSNGVSIVSGSRITVANPGIYNLQFSAQIEKTSNGVDIVYIWFKKNGVNVPRSNTSLDVLKQAGGGGRSVAAWNYVDTFTARDYIEIIWQSSDTNIQLAFEAASGNFPSIPSVIATLTQIA